MQNYVKNCDSCLRQNIKGPRPNPSLEETIPLSYLFTYPLITYPLDQSSCFIFAHSQFNRVSLHKIYIKLYSCALCWKNHSF